MAAGETPNVQTAPMETYVYDAAADRVATGVEVGKTVLSYTVEQPPMVVALIGEDRVRWEFSLLGLANSLSGYHAERGMQMWPRRNNNVQAERRYDPPTHLAVTLSNPIEGKTLTFVWPFVEISLFVHNAYAAHEGIAEKEPRDH